MLENKCLPLFLSKNPRSGWCGKEFTLMIMQWDRCVALSTECCCLESDSASIGMIAEELHTLYFALNAILAHPTQEEWPLDQ